VKPDSRMLKTGFQNTPVDSMATCVTRSCSSQSRNASRPRVTVPNERTSPRTRPRSSTRRTQAAMLLL
jgi:hypothetical protein